MRLRLVIGFVLLGLTVTFFGWATWRQHGTRGWPSTAGTVQAISWGGVHTGPRISYSYTVQGRGYTSSRKSYIGGGPIDLHSCKEGDPITVYYDPADPGTAVLTTEIGLDVILTVVLLVLVGASLLLASARHTRRLR